MRARFVGLLVLAMVALALPVSAASAAPVPTSAGRFIVTLRDGVSSRAVAAEYRRDGAGVDFVYTAALNGFAGTMSDSDLGRLRADSRVTRIERDGVATATTDQAGATWGLDRIDQVAGTNGIYTYGATGAGVTAYIIDTGMNFAHTEVAGRATSGYDAVDGGSADDCNGHGTHVAGTVGGTTYGVAKSVSLVAVRVLDCTGSGSWSGVIAGLDWVTANHVSPAAANMSLGGGASSSVDDAVRRTIASGVTMAVAAGNGNSAGVGQDACGYSPARVSEALTVGATDQSDVKTSWSNYGSCVDLFAPGLNITSAWYSSTTATNTISGTSMATPHVVGVAALYLQGNPAATPAAVTTAILGATTKDIVASSSTPNNDDLLYSGFTAAPVATGTVTGVVRDSGGATIVGATVSGGGATTTTDTVGAYSLQVPTGSQTISASKSGFVTSSQSVTVAAQTTLDFTLAAAPAAVLEITSLAKVKTSKNFTNVTVKWNDTYTPVVNHEVIVNGTVRASNVSGTSNTISWRGSGTLGYKICRTGTSICSAVSSITL